MYFTLKHQRNPFINVNQNKINKEMFSGTVLENDYWPPPYPINFVHDHIYFLFLTIYFFIILQLG